MLYLQHLFLFYAYTYCGDKMIVLNKDNVVINQYSELLSLSDQYVKVRCCDDIVSVYGLSLTIDYFDYVEIRIKGKIRSIVYENRL